MNNNLIAAKNKCQMFNTYPLTIPKNNLNRLGTNSNNKHNFLYGLQFI